MNKIKKLIDESEEDVKVIMVHGKSKTLREVIDQILIKDSENKRNFSEG